MSFLLRITVPLQNGTVDSAEDGTVTLEEVKMDEVSYFHSKIDSVLLRVIFSIAQAEVS